mgnify:CR=1 FL=1
MRTRMQGDPADISPWRCGSARSAAGPDARRAPFCPTSPTGPGPPPAALPRLTLIASGQTPPRVGAAPKFDLS